ncbi:GNAT family N-acetyltransferase [Paenibacillus sp. M1]|uniref:GNAT family N-acetyltransferase n=1 Tax=Paenibacillus haidiansis TaxID=1574488 RepID=A0ABU7VSK0_9BACL
MDNLRLVKPQAELKTEYLSFYREWKKSGEDMVPWVISKDPSDFQAMLTSLSDNEAGIGLPDGWVSDSTFWLIDNNNRVVGAVNIRHQLSEYLYHAGGHIGYGIRPSERRKGYATKLLELSLVEAKKLGIEEVLVVCDADNVGSEKTIIKNGGEPDSDYVEGNGNVIKRYWIKKS